MKFTIKDIVTFKSVAGKLAKNLTYAAIIFARDKVVISGMDDSNVVAAQLIIPRDKLGKYDYMPTENVVVNLASLITVLNELTGNVTFSVEKDKLLASAKNKKLELPIIQLGNRQAFQKWKPIVSWDTDGKIEGIKKIYMWLNKGPLVIDSEQDGYKLSWIIAPKIVGWKKRRLSSKNKK